ncbi:MAG: hypothetical protein NVSMB5_23410 [Candidatus Velthaea sp.]
MRVAVDALNLLADERGMGRYVRSTLRGLAARPDVDLTLLVRDRKNAADYRAIAGQNVTVEPYENARKRKRFDAVWYPWNAMRFRAHAPTLVTINDDFAFAYAARGFIARRREQRPIRIALRRATRIVTISQWSRTQLAECFDLAPERIALLPLAPDPMFVPARESSPYDRPFVLAVGGSEKRKNIGFLREIIKLAFPDGDVDLHVVGEDRARIDDVMLRRLYRTAAVVAVPSLAEGYGLVAAEAQACGAAVVAANTSALPEATGDAAALLDPGFRDAWIDALRAIVRDESLRDRIGARAAARWAFTSRDPMTPALHALLLNLHEGVRA